MKKYISTLLLMLSIAGFATKKDSLQLPSKYFISHETENNQEVFCDACGCAAGNGSSGFESLLHPQFVGIKYFAQHYKAKENLFLQDLTQDQYFNTVQLWGKIPLTKKLSIYGSLPYHFHEKKTRKGNISIAGWGDATLMGIYEILQSKNTVHQLSGGLGIKIPLAKFDETGITGVNPSFQLGTGSWDYQMALSYKYQKNLLALLLNSDYTWKTKNKKHYQFGNQWNYSLTGFYRLWRNENQILTGKLGVQGEVYQANKQFGEIIPRTAGSALYGKLGFETSYKKWSVGSEFLWPAYSNLAHQDIAAKSRFSLFFNVGL